MAGTLVASTISDGTNSGSTTDAIKGSAKAWVSFLGQTTTTVRAAYNVSSVTRLGLGVYRINFSNALADGNYSIASINPSSSGSILTTITYQTAPNANYFDICVQNSNAALTEQANAVICVSVFR